MTFAKALPATSATLAIALAALIPTVFGDYYTSFCTEIAITVLMLSSYRIIVLTGEWSFAHVVLQGVGAYTAAILAKGYGWPFPLTLPAGALMAATVAAVLSYPLLRMKGFYFLMGSFGAAEAIRLLWRKIPFFGGTRGLSNIRPPYLDLAGIEIDFGDPGNFFYLTLAIVVCCLFLMWRIESARIGRIWRAVNQQDVLAQSVGIDSRSYRRLAFVVAAGFAGVAGVLLAYAFGSITPNRFNLNFALYLMIWSIVGGTRTFYGVVLGGIILLGFDEALRFAEELRPGVYGLLLIGVMLFCPQGLERIFVPLVERLRGPVSSASPDPRVTETQQ
jgi:branched-chain amino acid transport system permease protein